MCEYAEINSGKCKVDNQICPYLFFCSKINGYKVNLNMPNKCKKKEISLPRNCYEVAFEKKGKLYVKVKDNIVIVDNPFDNVPIYVKMFKSKNGKWFVKEEIK